MTASSGGSQGNSGGTGGTALGSGGNGAGGSGTGGMSSPGNASGDSSAGCSCTTSGDGRDQAWLLTLLIFAAIGAARRRGSHLTRFR